MINTKDGLHNSSVVKFLSIVLLWSLVSMSGITALDMLDIHVTWLWSLLHQLVISESWQIKKENCCSSTVLTRIRDTWLDLELLTPAVGMLWARDQTLSVWKAYHCIKILSFKKWVSMGYLVTLLVKTLTVGVRPLYPASIRCRYIWHVSFALFKLV